MMCGRAALCERSWTAWNGGCFLLNEFIISWDCDFNKKRHHSSDGTKIGISKHSLGRNAGQPRGEHCIGWDGRETDTDRGPGRPRHQRKVMIVATGHGGRRRSEAGPCGRTTAHALDCVVKPCTLSIKPLKIRGRGNCHLVRDGGGKKGNTPKKGDAHGWSGRIRIPLGFPPGIPPVPRPDRTLCTPIW